MVSHGETQAQKAVAIHTHTVKKTFRANAAEEPAASEGTVAAPEQGFEGKDVQHKDMETALGDWRREYGPKGPYHHPAASLKSNAYGTAAGSAILLTLGLHLMK